MPKIRRKVLSELSFHTGRYWVKPEFVSLLTTFKCNFRCASCSIWKKGNQPELSDDQWLKIVQDLSEALPKSIFVEINGGEALIQKPLVISIIKEAKKHFNQVTLNSNGLLINQETVQELERAGLDAIKLSLYALDKEAHNTLRNHPLAYDHALRAIELIVKSKIQLEVGILLTSKNITKVPALLDYLKKYKNVQAILQPLDESVESEESKDESKNILISDLWPAKSDVLTFFSWLMKNAEIIKNSTDNILAIKNYYVEPHSVLKYRCFAGQRNLVIYPDGSLTMCFKRGVLGKVPEEKINDILKSKRATQERTSIRECKKYCRIIGCNFSRGFKEYFQDKLNPKFATLK